MSLRLVLAGCGAIAHAAHLPALAALRREGLVDLAGVCDSNASAAAAAARAFSVPHHGVDLLNLATETNAQAVVLCLPPGPHVDLAIAALERGLHVFSEKPPARSAAQAARMAAAARAHTGQITMIGFNRRFAPLYQRAASASAALGSPHAFAGRFTRAALGQDPSNTAADWITSDGSHALDLAVATIGWPTEISVSRRRVGSSSDNVWTIHLQNAHGSAVLTFDFSAGRRVERFEWSGPAYDVLLELPERAEFAARGADVARWQVDDASDRALPFNYGFVDEHRAFAAAIERGVPPATDFTYGETFMRLVETILTMPSAELRGVALERPKGVATHTDMASATRAATAPRGSVLLLQDAAARRRFFDEETLSALRDRASLVVRDDDQWRRAVDSAGAIVTGWSGMELPRDLLDRARDLSLVVVVGSSLRQIDAAALADRGVTICNTADAIAASVAEHCLALTLAALRHVPSLDRQMHRGAWPSGSGGGQTLRIVKHQVKRLPGVDAMKPWLKPIGRSLESLSGAEPPRTAHDLQGATVGLIGWGEIARRFAELLAPLRCEIVCFSDSANETELAAASVRRVSLAEAFGAARVVSLHRGLTAHTRGRIGAKELGLLAPGSVLVNTARGELVDESALVARASRGDIVCALDVFAEEPLPPRHALRKLTNVILTPHTASSTPECQRRVGRRALEILRDWLDGKPLPAIARERVDRMT